MHIDVEFTFPTIMLEYVSLVQSVAYMINFLIYCIVILLLYDIVNVMLNIYYTIV